MRPPAARRRSTSLRSAPTASERTRAAGRGDAIDHADRRRHRRHLHRPRGADRGRPACDAQAALDPRQLRRCGDRGRHRPARRAGLAARGAPGGAARLHGGDQRDRRAQRRQDRAAHHPGLPRRPRAAPDPRAGALRSALREAAAARAAPAALRGRGADRPRRRRDHAARRGRRGARDRAHPPTRHRGGRGVLPSFLRQSGARAAHRRAAAGCPAGPLRLALGRRAAAEARVRAHQHHGHQRLRRPAGAALPALDAGAARGGRRARPADGDAVERRHPGCALGPGQARADHRVRPGGRGGRGRARRAACGRPQRDHPRHGRHHRQGLADREGAGRVRRRVRGRGRHVEPRDARRWRRLRAQAAGDRHLRGRRGRRQHRLARQGGRAQDRPAQRRRPARPGLLRPGQRGADRDRRERRAGLPQSLGARRRRRADRSRARPPRGAGADRGAARPRPARERLRHPHRRQRQHDEGGARGHHLPRPRPARLRAARLRRQRRHARGRPRAHAPGRARDPAARRGRVQRARPPVLQARGERDRAVPPPRPGRADRRGGTALPAAGRAHRDAGRRRARRDHMVAPGRLPVLGPGVRAGRAAARARARPGRLGRAVPALRGGPPDPLRPRLLGRVPGRDREPPAGRVAPAARARRAPLRSRNPPRRPRAGATPTSAPRSAASRRRS